MGSTKRIASKFLYAYWDADLLATLDTCKDSACLELPTCIAMTSPAPMRLILPLIFNGMYMNLSGGRCNIQIERTTCDSNVAVIEYTTLGQLVDGRDFLHRCAMVIEVLAGKVDRVRSYADAQYFTTGLTLGQTSMYADRLLAGRS